MTGNNQHSKVSFYPQSKGSILSSRDKELYELCQISGTPLEPDMFKFTKEFSVVEKLKNPASNISGREEGSIFSTVLSFFHCSGTNMFCYFPCTAPEIDIVHNQICIELLRMDVSPSALCDVLHNMATQVSNLNFVTKRNSQNRTPGSEKKKPPVAAKPKKIKMETPNLITFRN